MPDDLPSILCVASVAYYEGTHFLLFVNSTQPVGSHCFCLVKKRRKESNECWKPFLPRTPSLAKQLWLTFFYFEYVWCQKSILEWVICVFLASSICLWCHVLIRETTANFVCWCFLILFWVLVSWVFALHTLTENTLV